MRLLHWFTRRRRAADAAAADRLAYLRGRAAATVGAQVVHVQHVYQRARRGTKAHVHVEGDGMRDAWFWHRLVHPGQVLVVHADSGWGPHTSRDHVLYVEHVHDGLPPSDVEAANRHYRRAQRG